jgi:hypothetical protein
VSERACERCSTPLEEGDLRCCICGMCAPALAHAPVAAEALRIVRCDECGAAVTYRAEKRAPVCRFCGAETHVERVTDPLESAKEYLRFEVGAEEAAEAMRRYLGSRGWWQPADLARRVTVDSLTPVYFAAWAFDVDAEVTWAADSDAGARLSAWAPHAGRTKLRWKNVLVSASRGLGPGEVAFLARGYDLSRVCPVDERVADEVERFDVERSAARAAVLRSIHSLAVAQIADGHVPGSSVCNVRVSALLEGLITRRVALPCYVLVYRYEGRPYRCLVHGRDAGLVTGVAPTSWRKIAAVASAVAVLILLALLFAIAAPR